MTLNLSVSRAAATTGQALAAGSYALSMVLLTIGAVIATIAYSDRLSIAWPVLLGFGLVAAAGNVLRWLQQGKAWSVAIAAVLIATGVWSAAVGVTAAVPATHLSSRLYFFSSITISVVFMGTSLWRSGHAGVAVTVATAGTQGLVMVAVVQAGGRPELDVPAIGAWLLVTTGLIGIDVRRRRAQVAAHAIRNATIATRDAEETRGALLKRAAQLHDTVLGDLAALTALPPGPLPPRVRQHLAGTAQMLRGHRPEAPIAQTPSPDHLAAVREARTPGSIPLAVTGRPALLGDLSPETRETLLLALTQCLSNADRHSGADLIEVSVGASDHQLSISVADDGVGFDPALVPPDRLGLRASVHGRLVDVGGRADVWSSPGAGTTVVLTVPLVSGHDLGSSTDAPSVAYSGAESR